MRQITRFFDAVYWLFMTSCKISFAGMVLICASVVFNRYVTKSAMSWGEPVVLMCMVYMSLVSAALAIRKDTHIRMQIIDFIAPARVVNVLRAAAHAGIFLFGLFMIVYGWRFSLLASRNIMTGVGIRSIWLYLACPAAGIAICLMEIERLINFFDRLRRGVSLDAGGIEADAKAAVADAATQIREEKEARLGD